MEIGQTFNKMEKQSTVVKGSSSSLPGSLCGARLALTQVVSSDRRGKEGFGSHKPSDSFNEEIDSQALLVLFVSPPCWVPCHLLVLWVSFLWCHDFLHFGATGYRHWLPRWSLVLKLIYLLLGKGPIRVYPREHLEVQALLAIDPFPTVCLRVPGMTEPSLLASKMGSSRAVLVALSKCSLSSLAAVCP